ncbi:MAG: methyltransferase family protein [Candidatus Caldatribacteriaceae bacterium]
MGQVLFVVLFSVWGVMDFYLFFLYRPGEHVVCVERWSKYVLLVCVLFGLLGGLATVPGALEAFMSPFSSLRYLAFLFMPLGILLRVVAVRQLGPHFSVDVGLPRGRKLYTKGLYSFIRHPSYLGEIVFSLGVAVALRHPVVSPLAFLLPLFAFLYRIRLEEGILLKALGEEYLHYRQRTYRLIPYIY